MVYWWKKSKPTQTDGEIYHVLELEEAIIWKWLYYPKQYADSMQSLSNYQWYSFMESEEKIFTICMETKGPRIAKAIFRKKNRAEESGSLTSGYTTKPH